MTNLRARYVRSLLASATMFTSFVAADAAHAAQPVPATAQPVPARVNSDEIVITGTRRTDRTVTNSASPIDVIGSNELTTQPTANLLDTVKNIVPSFFVGQYNNDQTKVLAAAVLTGLPVVVAYILLQRFFERGLAAGALK